MWAHTADRILCLTSRDLGVGNNTSPQPASDYDRPLENMPVLDNADTDKVKYNNDQNNLEWEKPSLSIGLFIFALLDH